MGKIQFLMDTSGHCFLCLKLTALAKPTISEGKNGGTGTPLPEQNVPSANIVSFRNICEYLKINLKEVCTEAMPVSTPSSSSSILERSELNGMLCADCIQPFHQFSKDFLELEGLRLKLKFSLKLIYERMVGERKDGRRLEELIRKQTSLKNGFVEQFRRKTLEKCSTMVDSGRPLVLLKKVTKSVEGFIPVIDLTSEYLEPVDIQSSVQDAVKEANLGLPITQEKVGEMNVKDVDQSVPESQTKSVGNMTARPIDDEREKMGEELIQKTTVQETANISKNFRTKWGPKKYPMSLPSDNQTQALWKKKDGKLIHKEGADVMTSSHITSESTPEVPPESGAPLSSKTKRARPETLQVRNPKRPRAKTLQALKPKLKIPPRKATNQKNGNNPTESTLLSQENKSQQNCKFCDKQFRTKKMLRRHLTVVHRAKFECEFCQKLFSSSRSSRLHRQTVHLGRRFQCKNCAQVFSQSATRNRHMKKTCTMRNGTAEDKSDLAIVAASLKKKQRLISESNLIQSGVEPMPITEFDHSKMNPLNFEAVNVSYDETGMDDDGNQMEMECDVCQEKVSDPADHKCTHFETHLTVNEKGEVEGEEVIPKLPLLIITHPTSSIMKPQFRISKSGKHKCGICSKEFPRNSAFQNHYRSIHLQVNYKCNLCGREFRIRSEYNRHHRDAHMGVRYKCDLCEKSCIKKMELLDHRQIVHFGKTGYQLTPQILDENISDRNLNGKPTSGTGDTQNKESPRESMSRSRSMSPSRPMPYASAPGSQKPYKFCVCKTKQPGRMVRCENNTCKFGVWFHYDNDPPCVQYDNEEVWYCSMCQAITNCQEVKTSIRNGKV